MPALDFTFCKRLSNFLSEHNSPFLSFDAVRVCLMCVPPSYLPPPFKMIVNRFPSPPHSNPSLELVNLLVKNYVTP